MSGTLWLFGPCPTDAFSLSSSASRSTRCLFETRIESRGRARSAKPDGAGRGRVEGDRRRVRVASGGRARTFRSRPSRCAIRRDAKAIEPGGALLFSTSRASGRFKNAGTQVGMTTRGAWIRDATETDALECGAAHHAIAFEPRVDRETPRVGGGRHDTFVCVPCAREYRGAWTGRTRQRQDEHLREFHLNLVPSSVREPRNDCRHFLPDSPESFFASFRVRRVSRLVTKRRALLHRVVLARRASREPGARLPSVPCSQPGTGDRAGSRRFARSPPGLFGNFPVSKSPRGVLAGERVGSSAEVRKVGVAT